MNIEHLPRLIVLLPSCSFMLVFVPVDCSLPGSHSTLGFFSETTGVGCHFPLRSQDLFWDSKQDSINLKEFKSYKIFLASQ